MSPESYSPSPEQLLTLTLLSQHAECDTATLSALARRADWKHLLTSTSFSLRPFLHFALSQNRMLDFIEPEVRGSEQKPTP
jgi:hypothetical protein